MQHKCAGIRTVMVSSSAVYQSDQLQLMLKCIIYKMSIINSKNLQHRTTLYRHNKKLVKMLLSYSFKVVQGHSKLRLWVGCCKVLLVIYCKSKYVPILYYYWHVRHRILAWPWNRVRGCSRSLKMEPIDRSYTTYYWSAIVSTLSCIVTEFFDTANIVTLKSGLEVTQHH